MRNLDGAMKIDVIISEVYYLMRRWYNLNQSIKDLINILFRLENAGLFSQLE